jgi:catechol 2,3-dioxygenase-like lactoylglutathione lyase family enzyme
MTRPLLNQVNIVAGDWEASLAFYRLLGLDVDDGVEWPPESGARHAGVSCEVGGTALEFDNPPMVRIYAGDVGGASAVLGFAYPSAEDVDAACARIAAAGHTVVKQPHDAFWGARYAIVQDPDGNLVGLMGPRDRSRGYVPSPP